MILIGLSRLNGISAADALTRGVDAVDAREVCTLRACSGV